MSSLLVCFSPCSHIGFNQRDQSSTLDTTLRGLLKSGFPPSSNDQLVDREDKARCQQPRDQPPLRPHLQLKSPPFYRQSDPSDPQSDNHPMDLDGSCQTSMQQQNVVKQGGTHQDFGQFSDKLQQGILPDHHGSIIKTVECRCCATIKRCELHISDDAKSRQHYSDLCYRQVRQLLGRVEGQQRTFLSQLIFTKMMREVFDGLLNHNKLLLDESSGTTNPETLWALARPKTPRSIEPCWLYQISNLLPARSTKGELRLTRSVSLDRRARPSHSLCFLVR